MIHPLQVVVNEARPVYVSSEGMTHFKPLIFDQTYSYDYQIAFDDKIELFDLDDLKNKMSKLTPAEV